MAEEFSPITRQVTKENREIGTSSVDIPLEDVEDCIIYDRHGVSIPFKKLHQDRKSVIIFVRVGGKLCLAWSCWWVIGYPAWSCTRKISNKVDWASKDVSVKGIKSGNRWASALLDRCPNNFPCYDGFGRIERDHVHRWRQRVKRYTEFFKK